MASLYVVEYPQIGIQQGAGITTGFVNSGPIAQQKIAIGGASTAGVAFNKNTRIVRLHTDAICSFRFGPPATVVVQATVDPRMAANATEYFAVPPDGSQTVAVITQT